MLLLVCVIAIAEETIPKEDVVDSEGVVSFRLATGVGWKLVICSIHLSYVRIRWNLFNTYDAQRSNNACL